MKHYRRFFALLLVGVMVLACAGCGTAPSSDSLTEPGTSVPPPGTTRPDINLLREVEQDGLVLRVFSEYQYKFTGEPFTLTASITNNAGRDITYGAGSGMPNMHDEIQVRIAPDFIDMDTYGIIRVAFLRFATLKAGETITLTIRFLPGEPRGEYQGDLSEQEINWYPAGEYQGTALFTWYTGTKENPGEEKQLRLEFPVVLI